MLYPGVADKANVLRRGALAAAIGMAVLILAPSCSPGASGTASEAGCSIDECPPEQDCTLLTDCAACLVHPNCAWCTHGNSCVETFYGDHAYVPVETLGSRGVVPACATAGPVLGNPGSGWHDQYSADEAATLCSLPCLPTGTLILDPSWKCCDTSVQTAVGERCGTGLLGESCALDSDCDGGTCQHAKCTCLPTGGKCGGDYYDCCSGNCDYETGKCLAECKPAGGECDPRAPQGCCTGYCLGTDPGALSLGKCAAASGTCLPAGTICALPDDCCSGSCGNDGKCAVGCSLIATFPCTTNADCGGALCSVTGSSEAKGTCVCSDTTGPCLLDTNCSTGGCLDGHCGCANYGAACLTDVECCTGVCAAGHCAVPTCGGKGSGDTPCCSGSAESNGECKCGYDASPCRVSADCCSERCDVTKYTCSCGHFGESCAPAETCCNGTPCGPDGKCGCDASSTALNLKGECCMTDQNCWSGDCQDGQCSCSKVGQLCEHPGDCCNGQCSKDGGGGTGFCLESAANGGPCDISHVCPGACNNGVCCVPPPCKQCGVPDGCGGTCGCGIGTSCGSDGKCHASVSGMGGSNGAGGGNGAGGSGLGGGGTGGGMNPCDASSCVLFGPSKTCNGYLDIQNNCGQNVVCAYTVGGVSACDAGINPGDNDCAIFLGGAAYTGQELKACVTGGSQCVSVAQSIGCSF